MPSLSDSLKKLIDDYQEYLTTKIERGSEPMIQVDEVASKVASFYEKVRNLIDYQEGHLLRKHVVSRALKRRIFLKDISGKDVAEPLIKEIIRSGHLGNNAVPESKIQEVQSIIDAVLFALDHLNEQESGRDKLSGWIFGIAVCMVEEALASPARDMMLADFMFSTMRERVKFYGGDVDDEDRDSLLFIAIQKMLLRADDDQLNSRLISSLHPGWTELSGEDREKFADSLPEMYERTIYYSKHLLLSTFLTFTNLYAFIFRIVGDLVFAGKSFDNLTKEVTTAYKDRYERKKKQLFRLAFFSVVSFLLSKILVAFAIEYPVDHYLLGHFSLTHAVINIVVPPILMLLIVAAVRLPSERNLQLVQREVESVVIDERGDSYTITLPKNQHPLLLYLVRFAYIAVFCVSLYYIVRLLLSLGFSAANVGVFVLFPSLIAATGVRIYNRAREISLEKRREGVLVFLMDLFTVPLVTIGRWFMSGLRKFNVLVILMDFFIEFPFQLFIEFLESFNGFLRRKKEEVI